MDLTLIATFVVGCALGAATVWAYMRTSDNSAAKAEIEANLAQTNTQFDTYRSEVNEHFVKTAQLVSNLTESYKEVHEYLSNSAMQLSNLEISRTVMNAHEDSPVNLTAEVHAPKDYAPKNPNDVGTLSESFGLEKPSEEPAANSQS